MNLRELSNIDLNLLVFLQALLRERHVTRAAQLVHASQPATSRALAKLRTMFGDPLLVRAGGEFQLTVRGKELVPLVEQVLEGVSELTRSTVFDPHTATGSIRIAAPDVVSYLLLPPLQVELRRVAPAMTLEVVRWQKDWLAHLERGEIDLTIGFPTGTESNIYAQPLFTFEWAVLLRKGHPILKQKWTPAAYASLQHVVITDTARGGTTIDDVLAEHGLKRRVALRVPYPLLASQLVEDTDLSVTTPRWLAMKIASRGTTVVRAPPFVLPSVRVPMVWHERTQRDPRARWVRELIREIGRRVQG